MKSKQNLILLIFLFILSFITFYRLIRPGLFSMMDDLHVFRLSQFDQCLKDGQIPCRFIKDGGMGYGYPLFNYYSPLAYSLAEVFHLFGFSLINSLKIIFALNHLIGAFGMYFFASIFWGRLGAFVSAIIFLFAPYQSTDSWVRGDLSESLAINLLPWVFYFLTKFINLQKNRTAFILLLSALLLSHNLICLAIAPVLLIYSLFLLHQNKKLNFKQITKLSIPVLLSLGLAAFFVIPAFFEKNLVTVDTMTQGYFYYVNHFATLKQLFISRFWGYGASLWGPSDDMAFSVGLIQWILPLIIIILTLFKKQKKHFNTTILFFIIFLFSVFLTHNKSTFIWKSIPLMSFFQFPWRFLSIAIFSSSFICGSIVLLFKQKLQPVIIVLITLITIGLNYSFFKEDIWYPNLTDNQKLTHQATITQSGAGLKDYWPKYSQTFPTEFAPNLPTTSTNTTINNYLKKSNTLNLDITATSEDKIILPLVYFPNWQLFIDNKKTNFSLTQDLGLIEFNIPSGNHQVSLKLQNTPIRTITNIISLISLLIILITTLKSKK